MSKKVVVLGESRDGKLRNVTFEAIVTLTKWQMAVRSLAC